MFGSVNTRHFGYRDLAEAGAAAVEQMRPKQGGKGRWGFVHFLTLPPIRHAAGLVKDFASTS
jgi:hypothetical protein